MPDPIKVHVCSCGHESYYHYKGTRKCDVIGCTCRAYDHRKTE